jgi:hypothetical protein
VSPHLSSKGASTDFKEDQHNLQRRGNNPNLSELHGSIVTGS